MFYQGQGLNDYALIDDFEFDEGDRIGTVKVNQVEVGERTANSLGQQIGQLEEGGFAEILSGLSVGDQVVVGGASYLQAGDVVSIVAEEVGI